MADRPNILLIVADCGRSDKWIGPNRPTVTPNMDRFCAQGTAFTTTITEKSCTTPNFATLLTGQYSPRHGVHMVFGYRLSEQVPTLTTVLNDAGYHTYAEVSGPLLPEIGLARGFEQYDYRAPCDYLHTAWGDRLIERLKSGYYKAPYFLMLHLWELHVPRQVLPEFDDPKYGANQFERSVSSLDSQLGRVFDAVDGNTLTVFTADHGEKTPDESFADNGAIPYIQKLLGIDPAEDSDQKTGMPLFKLGMVAGPSVLQQAYAQLTPVLRDVSLREVSRQPRPGRWTRLLDKLRTFRMMPKLRIRDLRSLRSPLKTTEMMHERGLLDETKAKARLDRMAESMGRDRMLDMHLRMLMNTFLRNIQEGHGFHVYDCLARVPAVLRWPSVVPAGKVSDRMVRQPDIVPTILDMVGLTAKWMETIDGQSFAPLLHDEPWQPKPAFLAVSGVPKDIEIRGVRTEDAKYTFGPENPELPQELYDLAVDPHETVNIAADRPEQCAELRALADGFVTGDQASVDVITMTPEEQTQIEAHLRDLGYID